MNLNYYVIKRDGREEKISFDKILRRIENLCKDLKTIDHVQIGQKVVSMICPGIKTTELDNEAAKIAINMEISTGNLEYGILSSRILMSNLHKNTSESFTTTMKELHTDGIINDEFKKVIDLYGDYIDKYIVKTRDDGYKYFGFRTLDGLYLLKNRDKKTIERPQYMWMRVAIGVYRSDVLNDNNKTKEEKFENVFKLYDLMSKKMCTLATPALFNGGTNQENYVSCFLQAVKGDSIEGMYSTVSDIAAEFKCAGGVGLHINNIRGAGSLIKSTNRLSDGIVPYLRVINNVSQHVRQGARRNGSLAVYLEVWHSDIIEFLELKKPNSGDENLRARDLFYALWICDEFMRRAKNNEMWYLMGETESKILSEKYGEEFDKLYNKFVKEKRFVKEIKAQYLLSKINELRVETGTPYLLSKDASNIKSNQKNLGTIKSSNLCCEIIEYSSDDETACCVLSSVCLSEFVENNEFNFNKLGEVVQFIVKTLNRVIDVNKYPTKETQNSNFKHRPLGIGVQGLADVFMKLDISFESNEAKKINKQIFETMYYNALLSSNNEAEIHGVYSTFNTSPAASGILQPELWGKSCEELAEIYSKNEWTNLKEKIKKTGLRNSLLIALMPTASTSNIFGNNECFEPITANIYLRKTLVGEFTCINEYLVKDLMKLNLWNEDVKKIIVANDGSVQNLTFIPQKLKEKHKTVWEIKQKNIIDMAIDRSYYVCQSQSMNLYFNVKLPEDKESDEYKKSLKELLVKMNSALFYSWEKGLKTWCYYTRVPPNSNPIKFTIDPEIIKKLEKKNENENDGPVCRKEEGCVVCSS